MSDLMYDKVPVKGNKYQKGDWTLYTTHNNKEIKGFFGEYRWLSNFWECSDLVWFEGLCYPSSENAYQAAKIPPEYRINLVNCKSYESKKLWKNYPQLDNTYEWDNRKYDVMSVILFNKFYRCTGLRQRLLDTGNKYLEETNHWRDVYWGVDINLGGQNNLGKILMKIRAYWQQP